MSRIRGRGNVATELVMSRLLRDEGITGWRRHYEVVGTPDFAFPKQKLALMVDGCFWHGCPRCKRLSKSNRAYWLNKVADNRRRDLKVNRELRAKRWRVLRVWQCQLKTPEKVLRRLRLALRDE